MEKSYLKAKGYNLNKQRIGLRLCFLAGRGEIIAYADPVVIFNAAISISRFLVFDRNDPRIFMYCKI